MQELRSKRLKWNAASSLVFQLVSIICWFVLPRLILKSFGSRVNGLVNSITHFLQVITFLELGVGAVVQSALYKPLADKNEDETSKIVGSAEKFFRFIALALIGYIVVLMLVYPILVNRDFSRVYIATLILVISISAFAQYYFGVVDRLLLSADQRAYIFYTVQTITLILNTIACIVLIELGATIHIVELITSLNYLLRPVLVRIYVNKNYNINRKIKYVGEPIKQKWNGIAQHIAAVVLEQTDVIVLTSFSSLTDVSIYSVYYMVVYGVKTLFISMTNGFQSLMGELLAKKEMDNANKLFNEMEWMLHSGTVYVFGLTGMLIVPFVMVYTKGINDANYYTPLFACLITIAHAGHCLRLPYNVLILAAGHYKQTQSNYIMAAIINIVVSVLTVHLWGLIGVAIGTMCAMFYQTIWMAIYDSRNILYFPIKQFFKHVVVDVTVVLIAVFLSYGIKLGSVTFTGWVIMALKDAAIWFGVVACMNVVFYSREVKLLINKIHK